MIEENNLTYEEYLEMINSVGWKCPSKRLLEKSLKNSMTVKYIQNGNIVGMARLVTDNGYMALVSDVIVKPEYQGKHIGKKMINSLFKDKSVLFRNALVRSNYFNNYLNIKEDSSYLVKFYENLLLSKNNNLHSRDLIVKELF